MDSSASLRQYHGYKNYSGEKPNLETNGRIDVFCGFRELWLG